MSAPRELNHPDDFVILTVDVADSPVAELRLSEIYDVETSTMNDDYLLVLQDYVALQLKATFGLCDRFKLLLMDSRFIPLHCRANGDFVSSRKPAMERLIRQTLQSRHDTRKPVSVSILIQFKTPGFRIPRRLHESPRIPSKIGGIASTSNVGCINHPTLDAKGSCALIPDLNVEPVAPHASCVNNKKHVVPGMIKVGMEHSDSGSPTRFHDSNNEVPLTVTTDIDGTCCNLVPGNIILHSIKSNRPEYQTRRKCDSVFDGNAFDSIAPDAVSRVPTELCNDVVGTGQGGFGTRLLAMSVMNPFSTGVAVIHPTLVTSQLTFSDKRIDVPASAGVLCRPLMLQQRNNSADSEVPGADPEGHQSFDAIKRSYVLWISNAIIMRQRCWSMLMMFRPIDRGRHLRRRPQHCQG